jgi:hypothetical protein
MTLRTATYDTATHKVDQNYLKENFNYFEDTGIFTNKKQRSQNTKIGDISGHLSSLGYIIIKINGRPYKAHRLAWLYVYGDMPNSYIDHINGIRDDNRIVNLRCVTPAENSQNRTIASSRNKLNILGVTKYKNKYQARIILNAKYIHLGYFDTIELAQKAYRESKLFYHPTAASPEYKESEE